jgi:NAD(P)-dependent dehydrogenase (short-subunit alcohol dehydrogenase family)
MRFADKVVLITGAGSGIGRAAALLFAEEGGKVVASDIDPERAKDTVKTIEGAGGKGLAVKCDVAVASDVEKMVREATATYGRIDILFANAGIRGKGGAITDVPEDVWDREWDIHVKGVYLVCKYAIPVMKKGGGGSIVVMSSGSAIQMGKGFPVYCAAKAASATLARQMALEYALDNIRVNAVLPGGVRTKFYDEAPARQSDPEGFFQRMGGGHPVNRVAAPEEVARVVLFLADDKEASFVTGACILVDGGQTLT